MAWESSAEREKNLWAAKAKADEALMPFHKAAPRSFTDESHDLYRRRVLPLVQQHAPGYENVKVDDARGTAFDLIEKQIYDAARQEASRPTQIAEGELREVKRMDASGRPFYEYFGKPSSWMSQFAHPKKQLVGVFAPSLNDSHFKKFG
jgi:hypothetical protein